jgi:glycosyltransferase involved in cell wall biosynthesis
MLNLFQHRVVSRAYETLKQVQGDIPVIYTQTLFKGRTFAGQTASAFATVTGIAIAFDINRHLFMFKHIPNENLTVTGNVAESAEHCALSNSSQRSLPFKSMLPIVSVIIPTYNRNGFLRAAIESVLKQTFQAFEIIVVDDASSEDVQGIVKGFHDSRIKCIRHEINKGEAGARNTGIMHAEAKYIAFLDDDDTWLPEKLKSQLDVLENSAQKVGGIYSGYIVKDCADPRKSYAKTPSKRGDIYKDLLVQNSIGPPSSVVVRRKCIETAGLFDENIYYGVDHDFYLRVAKDFHFEYIAEPLVNYSIHENRLSTNPEIVARGLEAMSLKYQGELGELYSKRRKYLGLGFLSVGVGFCYQGDKTKGIKAIMQSIRLYPFEPRAYFNLGLSLLGRKNFTKIKKFKYMLLAPFKSGKTIRY